MYPPDAATSRAKVYSFRLCLSEKFLSLSAMIWLWTGRPPGELTITASATAWEVLILLSLWTTFSVLSVFVWVQLRVDDSCDVDDGYGGAKVGFA